MGNGSQRPVRLLVVEDSATMRELLRTIFAADPGIELVGMLSDGEMALEAVGRLHPDILAIDYCLPGRNGLEVSREILAKSPVPIVIMSSQLKVDDPEVVARVVEGGVLALLEKPSGPEHPRFESLAAVLCRKIKLMSEIPVVTRRHEPNRPSSPASRAALPLPPAASPCQAQAVFIGVSAGGPAVLQEIFSALNPAFALPIVVAQHIPAGFETTLCEWLRHGSKLKFKIAGHGDELQAGIIYIAPGGKDTTVDFRRRLIVLPAEPGEDGVVASPSIARLFHAAAQAYGSHAIGIVLTGMGRDGAREMKEMKEAGAVTIAQDKDSSFIHGIPGEAIRLGAVSHILNTKQIVGFLNRLVQDCPKAKAKP